ncbi:MAG: ZIP family metal transporter [Verrucomicrobia bacterium]|nr:ZIP family metal transporter [Verrucomicrobiota bacterium]
MKDRNPLTTLALGLLPLVLLGLMIGLILRQGPAKLFTEDIPPVEDIHVLQHLLGEDVIHLDIVNSGADPTTVAQVMVRGAFWQHTVTPDRTLNPLQTARVTIHYPWVDGEPYQIVLYTRSGLTFEYEIEVALTTPLPDAKALLRFGMLGVYVGVIPVALGICWFPFLRRIGTGGLSFFLNLTVGLLVFLVVDTVEEGLKVAVELPEVYNGVGLFLLGLAGTYLILMGVNSWARARPSGIDAGVVIAWLTALGIGLHNLGEGLAIGSAYVLGELSLGAMLILGFTLHNSTEGIAIVAPILEKGAAVKRLIGLGLLAGSPTILGCWIGAFTYSQIWALLFLGIGAGALLQVIVVIAGRKKPSEILAPANLAGLLIGYLIMYGTGFLVGAA